MSRSGSAGTEPLIAQPRGNEESGQKPAQGDNAASDGKAGNIPLLIKQPPSPNKATVAQTQTAQSDPYQLRDLKAQEDMAYWAMWMFVAAVFTFAITSIGTFLIWRQVRLTRQAVEDTGEATEAMREANWVERQAQRPWVSIKIEPIRTKSRDGYFWYEFFVKHKNLGATTARKFRSHHEVFFVEREIRSHADSKWEYWENHKGDTENVLMPGEETSFYHHAKIPISSIEWNGDREGNRRAIMTIIAVSFYRSDIDEGWHRTRRIFTMGRNVVADHKICIYEAGMSLEKEHLIVGEFRYSLAD